MTSSGVVVDLDNTLLSTNTFKDYVTFATKEALRRFRIDVVIGVLWFVTLRKIRVISHSTMKHRLMRLLDVVMDDYSLALFVDELMENLNGDVVSLCEEYRNRGYRLLLATAAPECYAHIIALRMRFDGCCSTIMPAKGEWHENVREKKCEAVLTWMNNAEVGMDVVITDHYDDVPLLKANRGKNILVNPTIKTLDELKKHGIEFDLLTH